MMKERCALSAGQFRTSATTTRRSSAPSAEAEASPCCDLCCLCGFHALKHGSVLQHVWKDDESNFAAADIGVLESVHAAVARCNSDVAHLMIALESARDTLGREKPSGKRRLMLDLQRRG